MFSTILALALTSQSPPAPKANPAAAMKAAFPDIPTYTLSRKERLRLQVRLQERAEAEAQRRYAIEAQRQYQRMLPYLMEQQRQQLQRMSEYERNVALHRLAAAAEQDAMTYQWQVWKMRSGR